MIFSREHSAEGNPMKRKTLSQPTNRVRCAPSVRPSSFVVYFGSFVCFVMSGRASRSKSGSPSRRKDRSTSRPSRSATASPNGQRIAVPSTTPKGSAPSVPPSKSKPKASPKASANSVPASAVPSPTSSEDQSGSDDDGKSLATLMMSAARAASKPPAPNKAAAAAKPAAAAASAPLLAAKSSGAKVASVTGGAKRPEVRSSSSEQGLPATKKSKKSEAKPMVDSDDEDPEEASSVVGDEIARTPEGTDLSALISLHPRGAVGSPAYLTLPATVALLSQVHVGTNGKVLKTTSVSRLFARVLSTVAPSLHHLLAKVSVLLEDNCSRDKLPTAAMTALQVINIASSELDTRDAATAPFFSFAFATSPRAKDVMRLPAVYQAVQRAYSDVLRLMMDVIDNHSVGEAPPQYKPASSSSSSANASLVSSQWVSFQSNVTSDLQVLLRIIGEALEPALGPANEAISQELQANFDREIGIPPFSHQPLPPVSTLRVFPSLAAASPSLVQSAAASSAAATSVLPPPPTTSPIPAGALRTQLLHSTRRLSDPSPVSAAASLVPYSPSAILHPSPGKKPIAIAGGVLGKRASVASSVSSGARPLVDKSKRRGQSEVDHDEIEDQDEDDDDEFDDDDEDGDGDDEDSGGLDPSDKKKKVSPSSAPFQPMGLDRSSNSSMNMVFAMARAKTVYERLRVMLGMSVEAIRQLLLKQPFKPTHFFEMLNMANITHLDRTLVQFWADARRGDINKRMSTIHAIRDACTFNSVHEIETVLDAMTRVCISADFSELAMEYVTLRDMVKSVRASGRCFSVNSLVGFLARVLDNAQEHYESMKGKGCQYPDELYPGWTDERLQLSWMQYHAFDTSADLLRSQMPTSAAAPSYHPAAASYPPAAASYPPAAAFRSDIQFNPAAAFHGGSAAGGQASTFAYQPMLSFPSANTQVYSMAQGPHPMALPPPYLPMAPLPHPAMPPKQYAEAARSATVQQPAAAGPMAMAGPPPLAATVVNPQVPNADKLRTVCRGFQQGSHNPAQWCAFCHTQTNRGHVQACGLCANPGHGILQCGLLNEQLPAHAEVLRAYRSHWAALEAKAEQYNKSGGQPHRGGGRGGHSGYGRPRGGGAGAF